MNQKNTAILLIVFGQLAVIIGLGWQLSNTRADLDSTRAELATCQTDQDTAREVTQQAVVYMLTHPEELGTARAELATAYADLVTCQSERKAPQDVHVGGGS